MSSMSRSPLLPPYAMPPLEHAGGAADAGADAAIVSSRRVPFVPPSFRAEVPLTVVTGTREQESEEVRPAAEQSAAKAEARPEPSAKTGYDAGHDVTEDAISDPEPYESSDTDLPWIEEFGETSSGFPGENEVEQFRETNSGFSAENEVEEPGETLAINVTHHDDETDGMGDDAGEVIAGDSSDEASLDNAAETWAIDEAGPSISHIANELASASAPPAGASPTGAPSPAAHTPWQDDEAWMDIMPTLPNSGSHDPAMDTSWARAFSDPMPPITPPPVPAGDTQAAAASLETIARRLRSGELSVPGYHAEAGDAAALAAVLASLLGGRS